jgi:hypothetical protein
MPGASFRLGSAAAPLPSAALVADTNALFEWFPAARVFSGALDTAREARAMPFVPMLVLAAITSAIALRNLVKTWKT